MPKTRLALAASVAAAAALAVLLLSSAAAPAQDLQSKLEAKQAELSKVQERKGVLTTTISRYEGQIERLTSEVAGSAARRPECAPALPPSRPSSTARWPGSTSRRSGWRRRAPT